jgi:hypothetical protein
MAETVDYRLAVSSPFLLVYIMIEVLREMALRKLIEIEHTLQPKSKDYKEASDAALLAFKSLHEKLCNENQ